MSSGFKKGEKVFIRDYPMGSPTNVVGTIVGILNEDWFNVKVENGWNEGKIIPYKYWKLLKVSEIQKKHLQK